MSLVVSDTSPLNYLIILGAQGVLPQLYESIVVPREVIGELRHPKAPPSVRQWASNPPEWLDIRTGDPDRFPLLDSGEAAALSLALALGARLLVDESEARSVAASRGIDIIGTLGVIAEAHLASLLDFESTVARLLSTNYRVAPSVLEIARARISEHQR